MDNSHDMIAKGRMKEPPNGTANRAATHCKVGHELSAATAGHGRRCRICENAARRTLPPCAQSMGCLCWFHANGGAHKRPCNATEGCRTRYPRK